MNEVINGKINKTVPNSYLYTLSMSYYEMLYINISSNFGAQLLEQYTCLLTVTRSIIINNDKTYGTHNAHTRSNENNEIETPLCMVPQTLKHMRH